MRALLAALLLLTVAFAGCADGGDEDGSPTTSSSTSSSKSSTATPSGSTTKSSTSTSTGAPAGNRAPSGSLLASGLAGPAPFNVTFNLTGSDADGDALSWTLSFGDNSTNATGTELPANRTHTYAAAGGYNVTFTLTDGKNATVLTALVNVTASAAGGFQPVVYTASVMVPCPHCTVAGFDGGPYIPSVSLSSGDQGFDAIWLEVPAEMIGRPFTITSTGGDPDAMALSECSATATHLEEYGEGPEAGVIPAGTTCLATWEFEAPDSAITITVS